MLKRFFKTDSDVRSPEAKALIKGGFSRELVGAIRAERKNKKSTKGSFEGVTVTRIGYKKVK